MGILLELVQSVLNIGMTILGVWAIVSFLTQSLFSDSPVGRSEGTGSGVGPARPKMLGHLSFYLFQFLYPR